MLNKRIFFKSFSLFILISFLNACGEGKDLNDINGNANKQNITKPIEEDISNYTGNIAITVLEKPEISYDPILGTTKILLQFIPKTSAGQTPLSPDQVNVEISIDDSTDVEGKLDSSAVELSFSVNFGLVLDASYSMVKSQSFTPMLEAASSSVQEGVDIWKNRAGKFNFKTSWFNSFLYFSEDTQNRTWIPSDISTIPSPADNAFTKLYAAIDTMLNYISTENQENNQNIILVFSDGKDNYSYFDNSDSTLLDSSLQTTSSGAQYKITGSQSVSFENITDKIKNIGNITVHVIGLGDQNTLDVDRLKAIASASGGIYLQDPNTDALLDLFSRVTKEFTTIQSQGVVTPLDPGQHSFALRVTNKSGKGMGEYKFNFVTGDSNAKIL